MRIIIGILAVVAIVLLAVWAVDVDVTGDVELPEVEVSAEGGEMPAVDVNTVEVDATMEEETMTVPTIEVQEEEVEVPVPNIDVEAPEEDTIAEEDDL